MDLKAHTNIHTNYFPFPFRTYVHLLEDYSLIVEKRSACPNDPESYASGSVSSW
jgi:hypothetical protein